MIVRDEHDVLDRCLRCARQFADEIVVLDTGSTDDSREIALRYTPRVYDYVWTDDFAAARNAAYAYATCDYIMWLDADDVVPPASIDELIRLKSRLRDEDVVMLPYHTAFDRSGKPSFTFWRERITRRAAGFFWTDPVHEVIVPRGNIVRVNAPIEHRKAHVRTSERNLDIYRRLIESGKPLTPRQVFYYGCELYYHGYDAEAICTLERARRDPATHGDNRLQACVHLSELYARRGNPALARAVLEQGLFYASMPSAEALCRLGDLDRLDGYYARAELWYRAAMLHAQSPADGIGFSKLDCATYLPLINLGVCRYYRGDLAEAISCTRRALELCPDHPTALANLRCYLAAAPQTDPET